MIKNTDLLLFNFSNYTGTPVYPYAFTQVSALARKYNLNVRRLDMMGMDAQAGAKIAESYVKKHRPRMIGFTLRQLDSTISSLYITSRYNNPRHNEWFPVEDTKFVIDHLRQVTDIPIVMGGFSFSVNPIQASKYFGCDYGVTGEADSFFENFDNVLNRRSLAEVKNLVYHASDRRAEEYVKNERIFYFPLDNLEYNEEILEEIYRFHGYYSFMKTQQQPIPDMGSMDHGNTISIEISRGCRFQCNFCCEPIVKGRSPRLRLLDVVEEEIRFLLKHKIRYFWFVCSELNNHKDHALELAERILKINQERKGELPIFWRSYFLPIDFSREDMKLMLRSGLLIEQNSNFATLDDENLAKIKEPYRAKDAIRMTRNLIELEDKIRGRQSLQDLDQAISVAQNQSVVKDEFTDANKNVGGMRMLWPFTANHFATPQTFAKTARIFNEEGFSTQYDGALSYPALRLYDCLKPNLPEKMINDAISTTKNGHLKELNTLHPTFYYTEELVKELGSIAKLLAFLHYFHNTFMTTYYLATRDWLWFANSFSSAKILLGYVIELGRDVDTKNLKPWSEHLARGLRNGIPSLFMVNSLIKAPYLNKMKDLLNPVSISEEMFSIHPSGRDMREGALSLLFYILCKEKAPVLLKEIFSYLEIPTDENGLPIPIPYFFIKGFYKQYKNNDEMILDVRTKFDLVEDGLTLFLVRYLLYLFNVKIVPEYKPFLMEEEFLS